ncbi:MAG TPA: hypothetical protein PLV68_02670 [Ilumatobacteraceae bacterium]|nr:hypothetical protein [Ilumatobacteraceae bacterium]
MKKKVLTGAIVLAATLFGSATSADAYVAVNPNTGGSCTFTGGRSGTNVWASTSTCDAVHTRITMHVDGSNTTYYGISCCPASSVAGGTGTFAGAAIRAKLGTWSSWYAV